MSELKVDEAEAAAAAAAAADAKENPVPAEETEFEARLTAVRGALRTLHGNEKLPHLDRLCQFMEQMQLPMSARLFLLNHGVHSLDDVDAKDQELVNAAMNATKMEFSVRCIRDFVQCCKESMHEYDYPLISPTHGSDLGSHPQPLLRRRSEGSACPQWRQSTDTGYASGVPQQPPTPPVPKPRQNAYVYGSCRSNDSACVASAAAAAAAARAANQSEPSPSVHSGGSSRSGGGGGSGGGKGKNLIQMFLFPELHRQHKESSQKKKRSNSNNS